jgi:hypothetical protein
VATTGNAHLTFNIKEHRPPSHLVITVAGSKRVATIWKHRQRLEVTVYGAVAAVAAVFEIRETLDYE